MSEEAGCNTVSMMEAAASNNGKQQQQAKENGRASAAVVVDPRLQGISDAIRVVPHFPKPGAPILHPVLLSANSTPGRYKALMFGAAGAGIMFNDITTLLLRPAVFKDAVDIFLERYRGMSIDAVAGKQQPAPRPCPLHPCPPRSTWSSREVAVARRGAEF
jgi:adenine phosphoribosyltransferase